MKKVDVKTFINSLEKRIPSNDKFQKLGDLTALYKDKDGNFVRFNYERGPLIYALIAKYQPKNVLEFGTCRAAQPDRRVRWHRLVLGQSQRLCWPLRSGLRRYRKDRDARCAGSGSPYAGLR